MSNEHDQIDSVSKVLDLLGIPVLVSFFGAAWHYAKKITTNTEKISALERRTNDNEVDIKKLIPDVEVLKSKVVSTNDMVKDLHEEFWTNRDKYGKSN